MRTIQLSSFTNFKERCAVLFCTEDECLPCLLLIPPLPPIYGDIYLSISLKSFFFFGFYLKIYNTNLLMVEPFICFLSSFPFALYKLCASPKQEEFQYDRKKNKNKLRPHFIPKLKERN